MTSIRSLRHSTECALCRKQMIAPARAEYVSAREVHNLWCCSDCGYVFETLDHLPVEATLPTELIEEFLPNLMVA
jgi:hypothetical protein